MSTAFDRKRTLLTLLCQAVILVGTAVTAATGIVYGASSSQDGDNMIGLGYFKAFTMDGNILAGIAAAFAVWFAVKSLRMGQNVTPRWATVLQFVAAACLLLTFATVVCFLAPLDVTEGKPYSGMFSNDLFVFHLINPALAVVSFVFGQGNAGLKPRHCLWALVPVAAYTALYFTEVAVLKQWNDFYGFSFGGRYYLSPLVMAVAFGLTYGCARLLLWLNHRACGSPDA